MTDIEFLKNFTLQQATLSKLEYPKHSSILKLLKSVDFKLLLWAKHWSSWTEDSVKPKLPENYLTIRQDV